MKYFNLTKDQYAKIIDDLTEYDAAYVLGATSNKKTLATIFLRSLTDTSAIACGHAISDLLHRKFNHPAVDHDYEVREEFVLKKGWCLISYSAPSVFNDGNYDVPNDIRYDAPHDMPLQYLYDECQSCLRNDPHLYSGIGQILCDGWEPVSVGEIVGGRYGYGRLHSFKRCIEYNPGMYIEKENR